MDAVLGTVKYAEPGCQCRFLLPLTIVCELVGVNVLLCYHIFLVVRYSAWNLLMLLSQWLTFSTSSYRQFVHGRYISIFSKWIITVEFHLLSASHSTLRLQTHRVPSSLTHMPKAAFRKTYFLLIFSLNFDICLRLGLRYFSETKTKVFHSVSPLHSHCLSNRMKIFPSAEHRLTFQIQIEHPFYTEWLCG